MTKDDLVKIKRLADRIYKSWPRNPSDPFWNNQNGC